MFVGHKHELFGVWTLIHLTHVTNPALLYVLLPLVEAVNLVSKAVVAMRPPATITVAICYSLTLTTVVCQMLYARMLHNVNENKKLSYRRGTARCVVSIEILPIATQQCRNYLYDKSWPNRWYEVGDLHQKTRVPGVSCGVVCVILSFAVLVEHWQTDTDRHRLMASTADA